MSNKILFKPFEEQQLLISSPILLEKGEVELIDNSILLRVLFEIRKARRAIVSLFYHNFGGFGDISFALVTLYLIGRIQDILSEVIGT
jgi:hypothetical protein